MKSVMLISNPRAGSASSRTKEVIRKALQADFKLEVADTEHREHAIDLARDAADRRFDAVIAFGGDGTVNEVIQGAVGAELAVGIIPGGSTNVAARSLGVPRDPVEATAFVASHLRSGTQRQVNVGRVNDRHFLFCAGVGLDAEVVKRVEADPEAKRRSGEWFFLRNALMVAATTYRNAPATIEVEIEGRPRDRVVLVVCANSRPFTYFKSRPVDVCPETRLDEGLDLFGLRRTNLRTIPRVAWAVLVSRGHIRWKQALYAHDIQTARISCDRPLPVQVDGDYIGEHQVIQLGLTRRALRLLV